MKKLKVTPYKAKYLFDELINQDQNRNITLVKRQRYSKE